ncbi:lipopolysaccharide core heptose(II) kinase RfaY, partial [Escherichia coli]
ASAQRKAKDRIDLERHYGIKNEVKDLGYYLLVYRKKIRNLMRRLKGKPAR